MSMDSRARLDYALFQLTPTRTRFDLVLFSGGKNEKIASGLFEPFNTHLKYVRDQIHKGGYSIKLSPPTLDAPWFTKLTFQRFVRFVSTPAILERFTSLEREILLIERSFEANEVSNTNAVEQEIGAAATSDTMKSTETAKVKVEHERNLDLEPEESSKIQYQRLLGTRKMFLQKEQTMAYAGGLAAGFEMGSIDDLISFAEAFGASRLREACIDFKELCRKKHTDRLWMEELAKMEACSHSELTFSGTSGIVLMDGSTTNFQSDGKVVGGIVSNGSSDVKKSVRVTDQDSLESKKDDKTQSTCETVQVPMPWLHYLPQHFYNFQHPMQQLPPYQAFAFPAMTPGTSPYQMNVQWTPRENDLSLRPAHEVNYQKSSSEKKEKYRNGITESGKDRQIESSESESYSDSSAQKSSSKKQPNRKKYGKKSSKTVVIRNINYITPKSRNGEKLEFSDESSLDACKFIDEDVTVGSLTKSHESNYIPNRSNDADHQNYDNSVVADSSDRGKGNESWDTFKNLLMRDEKATVHIVEKSQPPDVPDECFSDKRLEDGVLIGTGPAMNLEMEKIPKQRMAAGDSFVSSKRDGGSDRTTKLKAFENGENFRPIMKGSDCPDEQVLVSQRQEESLNVQNDSLSAYAASKSRVITRKEEDWFLVKQSNKPENQDGTFKPTVYGDDCMLSSEGCKYYNEKSRNDVAIDDSFMVQTRIEAENPRDSQWKTDINMVADLAISPMPDSGTIKRPQEKNHLGDPFEANDLCMLLERDSGFVSTPETWTIDYGVDIAFMEGDRMCSGGQRGNHANNELPANGDITRAANNHVRKTKGPTKEAKSKVLNGSHGKRKYEIVTKSKKPSIVSRPNAQKSKLEKEEEIRKNMEELSIQRQKRIAERTAAAGYTAAATKKVPSENKTTKGSIKYDKNNPRSITQDK